MIEFIIFLVLAVVILLLNITKNKGYLNISMVFTIPWCFSLMIIGFHPYGLFKPSSYVYIISFISIIIFNLPLFFANKKKYSVTADEIEGKINYGLIYFLNVFAYIFSIPYLIKSIIFLKNNGFVMLRATDLDSIGQTTATALAFQWVALPVFTVSIIFSAIDIARKNKKILLFFFSVFDVFIYAVVFGGRYIILKYVFFLISAFAIVNGGKIQQIVSQYWKYVILGLVAIGFIIYITSKRSLSHMSLLGNIIGYYTGSFSLLSQLINSNAQGNYLGYGNITFGFILNFLRVILKIGFRFDYNGSDTIFSSFAANYYQVGTNIRTNSLTTMLYAFILDFGKEFFWIGVLIFSVWSYFFEKKFYKYKDVKWFSLYLLVLYFVFDSILVYDYISPGTAVTFILLIIVCSKVYIKRKIVDKEKDNEV